MELNDIVRLFSAKHFVNVMIKNTSHGENDYRENVFVDFEDEKIVIKIAGSAFADEEHLNLWERIADEYRNLGYYCPKFIRALDGTFPHVTYNDRQCIVWAEEYSKYRSAEELINEKYKENRLEENGYYTFLEDELLMDAKVASMHFDYTTLPSAYCMFELFDPADETDETTEDATKWYNVAKKLPAEFKPRVERIWANWLTARNELEKIYHSLPTSVFQADINYSNVLLDEDARFKGVYDFNIGGREVYINYLFRQVPYISNGEDNLEKDDNFAKRIIHALQIVSRGYKFSDLEKEAAPLLYKCIRPLWWYASVELTEAGEDKEKISALLDGIEYEQTRIIDFAKYM